MHLRCNDVGGIAGRDPEEAEPQTLDVEACAEGGGEGATTWR